MVVFPNAKINLGLNVIRKREDRYHDLETCFIPVPLKDVLEIIPGEEDQFTCTGLEVAGNSNLVLKAVDLLRKDFEIPPLNIHLHKIIPMGAGLGGGSADASFTLVLLNDKFELGLSQQQLLNYALQLGSDCPFFILNKPAIGKGRGEILQEVENPLAGLHLTVAMPKVEIKTKEAFHNITPAEPEQQIEEIIKSPAHTWAQSLRNDFQAFIFKTHAEIEVLSDSFYNHGATYAAMTGSGAAVFGVFEEEVINSEIEELVVWRGMV